jgi:hypothetical protein
MIFRFVDYPILGLNLGFEISDRYMSKGHTANLLGNWSDFDSAMRRSQVNCEKVREMPPFAAADAVSVSQNCTRMRHSCRLSQAAIFGGSFVKGATFGLR